MATIECGLIGCGTVGSAVVRLWGEQLPRGVRLSALAVRRPNARRRCDLSGIRLSADPLDLVRDPAISLLIDASPDSDSARGLVETALRRGKHVVTANKALVAEAGPSLERTAERRGVAFRYEAAAGGAVPIVAHLRLSLSPGPIRAFDGVLNGTSNFILSLLAQGVPFGKALRAAQEQGFAEADPERDTSGRDAADKLVILARLLGFRVAPHLVPTHSIESLTPEDARFGALHGWALRQVATFRVEDGTALAGVAPCFVPQGSPLAHAEGPDNVIVLEAASAGRLSFSGPGAGGEPTAAAILADVREILGSTSHASPAPPREVLVRPAAHLPRSRYLRIPGRSPVLTRPTSRAASLEGCPPGSVSIAVLEAA